MVRITKVTKKKNKNDKPFCIIEVEGSCEVVFSKSTGQAFAQIKKAKIFSNESYASCSLLVGSTLPGEIKKVSCEPYSFKIRGSEKSVTLDYRYQYVEESDFIENSDPF